MIYFGKSPDLAKWPICILPKQQNGKGINVELDVERSDYFDLISSHKRREPNVFDDNLNSPRLPSKYRYHPLIHTFGPSILTPRYYSLVSRGKVWIKVCNSQSEPDWRIKKAEPKLRMVLEKGIWTYFLNFLLNPTRPTSPVLTRSMVAGSANDYLFCLANLISLIGDSRLVLRTIFGQI